MSNFIETRGTLAKLMATEDLIIEFSPRAETASFDTQSRVLKLPLLKGVSDEVLTMLVAHEVGHAKHTPVDWNDLVPNYVPFDFVNVIEDIRIERMIQEEFPGLRRDFAQGYDNLNERDFFALEGKDISKMSFIDRINLDAKLGARALINFTDDEKPFVTAAHEADTFDKVLLVSKMIADFVSHKQEQTESPQNAQTSGSGENEGEQQPTSQMKTDGQPSEGGNQDAPSNQAESSEDAAGGSQPTDEGEASTQRSFEEHLKELQDNSHFDIEYVTPPVFDDMSSNMFDNNQVIPTYKVRLTTPMDTEHYLNASEACHNYLQSIKGEVNFMVTQFEMKKAAHAFSRSQSHKTGVLDTSQLHNYKLVDDIFKRQTLMPDGKNHGMVMFLDWSGSMDHIANDTVRQILLLVQFCRKVQIPFEVYTFTSGDAKVTNTKKQEGCVSTHNVILVKVLSSDAKPRQLETDMVNLWVSTLYCAPASPYLGMGGTPLNAALTMVPQLIRQFQSNTGAEKVSFVCITDGESSPLSKVYARYNDFDKEEVYYPRSCVYSNVIMKSQGHQFSLGMLHEQSGRLGQWIETQVPGVSVTNIFLGTRGVCQRYVKNFKHTLDEKLFAKEGSQGFVSKDFYPNLIVMNPKSFTQAPEEIEVEAGVSKAKMKAAFNKFLKGKKASKKVLSQLVTSFS